MGGFNSAFLRIPGGQTPTEFADRVRSQLSQNTVIDKTVCRVQFAQGFNWIHVSGFDPEHAVPVEQEGHPLGWFDGESIILVSQTTSDAYLYLHFLAQKTVRIIVVCEWEVHENLGLEEFWESDAKQKYSADSWPNAFNDGFVIEAFKLPSPWSNQPPTNWEIDFSWS